jgi:hypothetical protein
MHKGRFCVFKIRRFGQCPQDREGGAQRPRLTLAALGFAPIYGPNIQIAHRQGKIFD